MKVPIIDIFAGPGGLGEGFSSYKPEPNAGFKISLSIEKEHFAHQTLELRSFFRQFDGEIPEDYYHYLQGRLKKDDLFLRYRKEAELAQAEAWNATLGDPKFPAKNIDARIKTALKGKGEWILIGGPPCQAYSLAGRSRMAQEQEKHLEDKKHFLYEEYLRIIEEHKPAMFVMENVKGLLSAVVPRVGGRMFERILEDLKGANPGYRIYSLSTKPDEVLADGTPVYKEYSDFLIKSDNYGIPQSRHRIILLGVRKDVPVSKLRILTKSKKKISVRNAISDLPGIRSRLSSRDLEDSFEDWGTTLKEFPVSDEIEPDLKSLIKGKLKNLTYQNTGAGFISYSNKKIQGNPLKKWYFDPHLSGEILPHIIKLSLKHRIMAHFPSETVIFTR